ncbi:MAG: hypothetical protein Q6364_13190 [Candidatus Hermodarchaeota archaeon]|nr:hypothetical protein [Candidatus Hermodarchaeota archaeon]
MRKRRIVAIVSVFLLLGVVSWLVLTYVILPPDGELKVQTTDVIGTVNQLVGVNDYGPDVTGLYEDQVGYDLFRDLGLQRLRVWCQFGAQLAWGLGWGWYHTIFNGSSMADAQNSNFYNWTYLDILFEVVNQTGAQPILTFNGCPRSIAQDGMPNKPPLNYDVYAEVVARVLMHYTQDWPGGSGHTYSIDYVEIGNEPNLEPFWNGSSQEFFDLYAVVSQRLDQLGGTFKIGGPGLADAGLHQWTTDFLSNVSAGNLPLDFFSWHSYWENPVQVVLSMQVVKDVLIANGYGDIERVFDEWGLNLLSEVGWGTMQGALHATGVLTVAAHQGINITCFAVSKDAPVHPDFSGLFGEEANFGLLTRNPTIPKPIYHALKPFVTVTGNPILQTTLIPQPALAFLPYYLTYLTTQGEGLYNYTVLVANHGLRTIRCRITLEGAPQATYHVQTRELSDASLTQYNDWTPPTTEETGEIIVQFPPQSVIWIEIYTSGPYVILSCRSSVQVQLFAIASDVTYLKLQIAVKQGYAICST